ncbi:glycoside hydrolase family 3 C-terminal domain-containing protein [Actinacidiphila acididurans]|uniref:Probable beta-glucosidase G n=1 Tax=Actinacidiphila acididurans TaxID=2784346 RepID=A0ABS2U169_9ACTN|nr:glycoside hydrolase family 3 C-terminal domain-containing protein [Actinacidiphila acididurans]MBM9509354.1 glycoside hydrolase family 3 C-terminal domain-containing protein [Actinacidiphila acididurans]
MTLLSVLRPPAPARRGPRPPRRRPTLLALLVVGALFALSLVGAQLPAYAAGSAPFGGTPAAVPGTVQAANYDTGGQGVAYSVTAANGSANSYRSDGVDLETTADTQDTTAAGGAYDMGWTTPAQWFKYTVNVTTAGTYSVAFRVSSPYGITDALHIADSSGTNLSGAVAVPNTGGYETWTTVTASVTLPAGQQTLTVDQDSNGWNFHYLVFTLGSGNGSGGSGGDQPYGGTPAPVPGTVQAANYDTGGQGVAYSVTAANGTANSYRSDGVDLESTADTQDTGAAGGAYDMGWITAGQWFKYTVQVATAGVYTVSFRVASPYGAADALHIADSSGANLSGAVAVPNTGGYETWTTVTASVTLPAGRQTLTVDQDSNGWNFHYLAFTQGSGGTGGPGPTEYCGTQDLALDEPTTASSTQDAVAYPAFDATDGDPGSRWSSAATDPQWLEVDLGSAQQICSVGISWEAAYAKAFQVQVSNDNSNWTTIYSTTTGTGGNQTFPASVTDRYVRMNGTARATSFGYSIFELQVYGLTTVAPVTGGNGNGGNGTCPWVGSTAPVAQRVQQVLTTMNQSEEASLLSGDGTSSYIGQVPAIPNLCIPALNMEDGPSGVGDGNGGVTAFPDGENAAATFDTALIQQEGVAKGAEFAGKGANVSLGPTTNLVRDPRWGRTYETYGEDPFEAGQITAAEVTGMQSQGTMAMVKHVAAYDQERYPNGGDNETVSQKALEELYLAPFQSAIAKSSPAAMMCSYAVVNNASSCQNADLLENGLDQQANYDGFVTSDWGGAGNAVATLEAGMNIAMPFSNASSVTTALSNGTLSQAIVNARVAQILTQMFAFGMFDNPASGSLSATVTTAAHQQTALQLGEEGTVLLKNNGTLPLNPNPTAKETIAVIGTDGGAGVELGGGGSGGVNSSNTVWPLTGVQNAVGPNVTVTYTAGDDNGTADIPQAVAAAQSAAYALVYVSAPEGEESDLSTLNLSSADETMITDVAAANPHTIVVINSGSPVIMPWINSVAGVFENWYGGGETGAATAALIFGAANPSGKLPVTFPASLSQVPAQTTAQWPGTPTGPTYSEGVDIGYRWYQQQNITPAFPFGFGLSYTKFAFSNLNVGAFNANGKATVTATITNTGSVAGADVAQLYVGDPAASADPPEQLAGFQRVMLNPGQSATVTFPLTVHSLASWSAADNQWEAAAGTYSIKVGDASNSLPLSGSTSLAQTLTGQVAAGASGAGVSPANTAVSANVTANSGVPGAETVGVVNPFGYSSPKGKAASFAMQAVDSNASQTPTFTATGLPPGITIASNGTVSGTGSTPGTYTVTVTATDTAGVSGTATFVWTVTQ